MAAAHFSGVSPSLHDGFCSSASVLCITIAQRSSPSHASDAAQMNKKYWRRFACLLLNDLTLSSVSLQMCCELTLRLLVSDAPELRRSVPDN